MAAPITAITRTFTHAVRGEPFFQKWRKEGVRRYFDRRGPIHLGVELVLFKHSWENDQVVGLGVHLGYPTTVVPLSPGFGGESIGNVFVATTYVSPTSGMGVPTYASDRAMHLRNEQDLARLESQLPRLLKDCVVPWLIDHSEEEGFFAWYFAEHAMPSSLPLVLAKSGPAAARRALGEWVSSCPEQRGGERLVSWLKSADVITPEMWSRFRLADMQAWEDYCTEMRDIGHALMAGT